MKKMDDKSKIIETLKTGLKPLESIHAMWLEGSLAENVSDEHSDLDIWLSVDDDKLHSSFEAVEKILNTIAPIDFSLVVKRDGELGHNVYHLSGMSEFLTLDINTQKLSRDVVLTEGIDIYRVVFDKSRIIRTSPRKSTDFNKELELARLLKMIDYAALSVKKNALRGKKMEAQEYYRNILIQVLVYLRKKASMPEKIDFEFKHVYKDIPDDEASTLEEFYFASPDQNTINDIKSWLQSR